MGVLSLLGIMFVILGIMLFVSRVLEQKRTAEMKAAAMSLGYDFYETDPGYESVIRSAGYPVMGVGSNRKIRNILARKLEVDVLNHPVQGMETVFDYTYTTGSGRSRTTYNQTVISFKSDQIKIPCFYLREEGLGTKILSKFVNVDDINFEKYPKFSNKYILFGSNEQEIREFFDHSVITFFENFQETIRVETSHNSVMIYVSRRSLGEKEISSFSEILQRVTKIFVIRSSKSL